MAATTRRTSPDWPRAAPAPAPPPRPAGARPVAEDISIGGIVSGLRPLKTRKGDRMCVFMLDDASGSLEVVVFPEAFKQYGHLAENGQMVLVKGKFERDDESARILASEIAPIEMVRERLATSVAITAVDAAARPRRRSRSCGTCSRSTRATAAWRSTSQRAGRGTCA